MDYIENDELDLEADTGSSEPCSKDLKKYFYVIFAVAVMILLGTYWYQEYYAKGVGTGLMARAQGAGRTGAPVVANGIPRTPAGNPGARGAPAANAQTVANWAPGAANPMPPMSQTVARRGFTTVAAQLRNSVTNIHAVQGGAAPPQPKTQVPPSGIRFADPFSGRAIENMGSGVIVRADGYIATNYHVVRGTGDVFATVFDNSRTERYRAEVVKLDEALDLALLKIEPKMPLTPARLGDSDRLQVADEVIAIGSPFGLDQTVSRGIVSAKRKSMIIEGVTHTNLIQTDAAINQGNSGGPLVDIYGNVIGINTAIFSPTGAFSGVGFAVPINHAKRFLLDELEFPKNNKRMARNQTVALQTPRQNGGAGGVGAAGPAIVAGTPAPHADGREKMDCATCHQLLPRSGGAPVAFQYDFAQPPTSLAMNVAGAQGQAGQGGGPGLGCRTQAGGPGCGAGGGLGRGMAGGGAGGGMAGGGAGGGMAGGGAGGGTAGGGGLAVMGARVHRIGPGLAERLNHTEGRGLFVQSVFAGSPTANAGVQPGDIILKLDGRRIRTPEQFAANVTKLGNGSTARLDVLRDGRRQNLDLSIAVLAPGVGAPVAPPVPTEFNWLGMEIETFIDVVPAGAPGIEPLKGAEIAEIVPDLPASRAGLQANDVILEINRQSVGDPALFDRAMKNADGQPDKLFRVSRAGTEFYVVIP